MTTIRILHVDDEPDIREVVELSLGLDPGFVLQSCGSGKEALAVAAEWQPDFILLDVMMPVMDGPATLVQLQENARTASIPVIFMTIGGLFFLFFAPDKVVEGMVKYGYPADAAKPILITEILCGLIYAIPQTATLGAVLMTAYLGGAVATHVHAGEPFFFPIIFGVLAWLGLLLRDARIRSLLPLRRI